jgi:hypothetical protein
MIGDPPDPAQSGVYVRIGRFREDDDKTVVRVAALDQADVKRVFRRHADRMPSGEIIRGQAPLDGNGTTLGFVAGIPIVLRAEGEVHFGDRKLPDRFDAFLKDLCVELGCAMCVQFVGGKTSSLIRFVQY